MASFVDQQHKLLGKIIKELSGTTLGREYGLQELQRVNDPMQRAMRWAQQVPLFTAKGWQQFIRQKVNEPNLPLQDILARPGFVVKKAPRFYTTLEQMPYGQSAELVKSLQTCERDMLANLKKIGLDVKGKHFHMAMSAPQGDISLERLVHSQRGGMGGTLPTANVVNGFGKTRYQQLNGFAEVLEEHGKNITHISAAPADLAELSFVLAQRAARLVSAKDICPNLRTYIALGPTLLPERYELAHFFGTMPVRWVQQVRMSFGLHGWQDDVNLRGVMRVSDDLPCYLEFIPAADLLPTGQPKRDFRRFSLADVQAGQEYVLVTSSASGWLGLNTQWMVKVISTDPLRISYRGHTERLIQKGLVFDREALNRIIDGLNQALGGFSMFVRDYRVGYHQKEDMLHWVMEINRPTNAADEKLLQSLANRLHSELALSNPMYQEATKSMATVGKLHFVPIGTLATLPESTPPGPFDFSADTQVIQAILQRAYEPLSLDMEVV